MKTIRLIGIVLLTMLMSVCYSACGDSSSDDESNNSDKGGGEKTSTNKLLVKETVETEINTWVTEFTYDNNGRLIQYKYRKSSEPAITHSIAYNNNSIIEVSSKGRTCEYTLENGLITRLSYSDYPNYFETYTYDNNGYMTAWRTTSSDYYEDNIWNGGNLVRKEGQVRTRKYIRTYEYTSYLAPTDFHYLITDDDFGFVGHFGKSSRNLPSKITDTSVSTGKKYWEQYLEWVIEDGLPVKVIILDNDFKGENSYLTFTITYEWK